MVEGGEGVGQKISRDLEIWENFMNRLQFPVFKVNKYIAMNKRVKGIPSEIYST